MNNACGALLEGSTQSGTAAFDRTSRGGTAVTRQGPFQGLTGQGLGHEYDQWIIRAVHAARGYCYHSIARCGDATGIVIASASAGTPLSKSRVPLTRFHGVFIANSKHRAFIPGGH